MVGHPPTGADWEVSSGHVERITLTERIHVRATLGPGYSGGPAVNPDGRVVGIVSYRAEGGEQSYLVPIDDARMLLPRIITPATGAGTFPVKRSVFPEIGEIEYQFQSNLLRATVMSAGKDEAGKNLTIANFLENISDVDVKLHLQNDGATAIDDQGGTYYLNSINGVARCAYAAGRIACAGEKLYSNFTTKSKSTLVFSFFNKTGSPGRIVSFSGDSYGYVGGKPHDMSIGIPNIKLDHE